MISFDNSFSLAWMPAISASSCAICCESESSWGAVVAKVLNERYCSYSLNRCCSSGVGVVMAASFSFSLSSRDRGVGVGVGTGVGMGAGVGVETEARRLLPLY